MYPRKASRLSVLQSLSGSCVLRGVNQGRHILASQRKTQDGGESSPEKEVSPIEAFLHSGAAEKRCVQLLRVQLLKRHFQTLLHSPTSIRGLRSSALSFANKQKRQGDTHACTQARIPRTLVGHGEQATSSLTQELLSAEGGIYFVFSNQLSSAKSFSQACLRSRLLLRLSLPRGETTRQRECSEMLVERGHSVGAVFSGRVGKGHFHKKRKRRRGSRGRTVLENYRKGTANSTALPASVGAGSTHHTVFTRLTENPLLFANSVTFKMYGDSDFQSSTSEN